MENKRQEFKSINSEHYYQDLGITNPEEVTDESVFKNYLNIRNSIVDTLLVRSNNIAKVFESLDVINAAYNALKTKEDRKRYNESLIRNVKKSSLDILIEEEGGNVEETLDIKKINSLNRVPEVKKNSNYLQYTTEYEDGKIKLLGIAELYFMNGNQFKDHINKYTIWLKDENANSFLSHDFYSIINIIEMSDPEYRIAIYKAVKQAFELGESYIGTVGKNENDDYVVIVDGGQRDAAVKYEEQIKKEFRKKNLINEGESR